MHACMRYVSVLIVPSAHGPIRNGHLVLGGSVRCSLLSLRTVWHSSSCSSLMSYLRDQSRPGRRWGSTQAGSAANHNQSQSHDTHFASAFEPRTAHARTRRPACSAGGGGWGVGWGAHVPHVVDMEAQRHLAAPALLRRGRRVGAALMPVVAVPRHLGKPNLQPKVRSACAAQPGPARRGGG